MRVDGTAYSILGASAYDFAGQGQNVSNANITNKVVTPTQIALTAQAGPMQVNITFFNPVEVRSKFFNPLNLDSAFSARRLGQAINTLLIPLHYGKLA